MAFTFISGATGGIGKAFVDSVAKRGNDLFLTGRSIEKLTLLKNQISLNYQLKVEIFPCELTSEKSRREMVEFIDQKGIIFDRIILVAGVDTQMPFRDYTLEKVHFQLRVNAESTISLFHQLLERKSERTEVIVISSMSGVSPMPYFALYSATKSMLTNFFTAMHYELKKDGVKVTVVMPGGVPTRPDIINDIKGQGLWGKLSQKSPSFVAEKSLKKVKKNKIKYIPGGFNKFLYFIMKIAPKKLVLSFIAHRWKNNRKDAFN